MQPLLSLSLFESRGCVLLKEIQMLSLDILTLFHSPLFLTFILTLHVQQNPHTTRTTEVLLGKNTMIRCCLRGMVEEHPQLAPLIEFVRGNIGFVFTKGDLADVKKDVIKFKVAAPAKAGAMAPRRCLH
jgi:hypothetical protein